MQDTEKDIIYNKYKYIVDVLLHDYKKIAIKLGIDLKEFRQEAYYAFSDALNNFKDEKQVKIETFITVCVRRRLQKVIKSYGGKKAKTLNNSYSLDYDYDKDGSTLKDIMEDNYFEPLNNLTDRERYEELINAIKGVLSLNEYKIFTFLSLGYNGEQIAKKLNKNIKQVNNTIQRIRQKIRNIKID